MNNCTIVLLGATGDLARRKIFPALFQLFIHHKLENCIIIGAALEKLTSLQFHAQIKHSVNPADDTLWNQFCAHIFYMPMDFLKQEDFFALHTFIINHESSAQNKKNRLVYCATAPYFYSSITIGLAQAKIITRPNDSKNQEQNFWQRIAYEKPFGHDLVSARELNTVIATYFDEDQIFRIDHYLAKEIVNNIALLRFSNISFEPVWNNRFIEQVQIIFDEHEGIKGRGAFFDHYGILADVVQNHMMQLMALIAMEAPGTLSGDALCKERARVLQNVSVKDVLLAQYQDYTKEQGVSPNSTTATFAQLYLEINNSRWAGVPFYLRAGKYLNQKKTAVVIKFKSDVMPAELKFSPDELAHGTSPEYEIILEELFKGEKSLSVRFDEIEYAWQIIDAAKAKSVQLYTYQKESKGPDQASLLFDEKYKIEWKL